jgi:type IV secretory pathway VirB2 component (pilin)
MQKVNKFLKEALQALLLVWMLMMTVVTIDQAAANSLGWKSIFRVRISRG